jgi:prepilin-type N-terminal cleavage/methylation domain-containing protein
MAIKSIQQEKGFTLVEIMVALVILSVGLMGAAYMQTNSVKNGTTANRLTRRVNSAEDRLEDFYIKDIKPGINNQPELCEDKDFYIYGSPGPICEDLVSPYYDIQAQALGGVPLENLTTIQITVTPKGEKSASALQRRRVVFNLIRSTKYNK